VSHAIEADSLAKSYGSVRALDGLDLAAEAGTTLGILGPNGAGKTTLVRILTTLLRPDAGRACVAGFDVVRQPDQVRPRISLTGQYAALDERLTGRENLELVADLHHLARPAGRAQIRTLIERLELADAADRPVQTYSGGLRRRLDLAAGILPRPEVVVLDEPTTGLDPRSRIAAWELIEEVVGGGTTVLLTTQYLEEAERLADRIAVMDRGRVVAFGSPAELKASVGGERLVVRLEPGADPGIAADALRGQFDRDPTVDADGQSIAIQVSGAPGVAAHVVRALDDAGLGIDRLEIREPTLDDAFLALTGHPTAEPATPAALVAS
jgi:ABC-2 type transport system ATP-binding protein